jgi:hypothetical protein
MTPWRCALLALTLAALVSPPGAEARIETLTIEKDDRRLIHIQSFGFEPGGNFTATMKEFAVRAVVCRGGDGGGGSRAQRTSDSTPDAMWMRLACSAVRC